MTEATHIGRFEGDKCGRDGCDGNIEVADVEGCTCHINPPCTACTSPREYCDKCDWNAEDEDQAEKEMLKALEQSHD